ncbi:unnamed protein product [Allacma fusca]|uniref:Uncharacterized protein n=1 Tax=Allacma fusca TaxID=39272 RepID=A0A8J2JTV5_9HEXA|nr:unnamed protein product [Allacma fusca]
MTGRKQTFPKPMPDCSQELCSQIVDDFDFEESMEDSQMCIALDEGERQTDNRKAAAARKRPVAGPSTATKRGKQPVPEYNWSVNKPVETSSDDPIVRAAIKIRLQREAMNSNKANPLGTNFIRPLQTAVGKDHLNNETDSDQFFHSNYTYRVLDLCIRRSRTERYGHYLHFLKLRQINGDIIFHKRMGIQADAIPALIRCLTEIQNEIQAYPKNMLPQSNF